MNKATPIILLFLSVALGAGAIYEYQQAEHYRELVAQMSKDAAGAREENDDHNSEIRKLKEQTSTQKVAIEQLETRNKELANGASPDGAKPTDAAAAGTAGKEGGGDFMKGIAKMFTDPKMKNAMRAQQAAGINMMYGDLARELGLTPDQAKQVLALLADRQMDLAGKSMTLMSEGGKDAATLAEVGKETTSVKAGYDDQIKAVLGPDKYAQFQDYEKSVGERLAIDQAQKQLSASGMPLDASQSQGLLAIMTDERTKTPNPVSSSDTAAQMKMMESDASMDAWLKSQEDFNQRVLNRARSVLSPDQMLAFEAAQKQQIEMQRMGVQMSREMFKGKGK